MHHLGNGGLQEGLEGGAVDIGKIGHRHEELAGFLQKGRQFFLFFSGRLDVFLVGMGIVRGQTLQFLGLAAQLRADLIDRLFAVDEKKDGKTKQAQRHQPARHEEEIFFEPFHVRASSGASI